MPDIDVSEILRAKDAREQAAIEAAERGEPSDYVDVARLLEAKDERKAQEQMELLRSQQSLGTGPASYADPLVGIATGETTGEFALEATRGASERLAGTALGVGQAALQAHLGQPAVGITEALLNRYGGEGTAAKVGRALISGDPYEVMQRSEPETPAGRIGRRTGEYAAMGAEAATALGGAGRIIPAAEQASIREAPWLAGKLRVLGTKAREFLLSPYRKAQAETTLRDIGLGGLAGMAGGAVIEGDPELEPGDYSWGLFGTELAAGGLGALGESGVRAVGRKLPGIRDLPRVAARREAIAADYAGQHLQRNTYDISRSLRRLDIADQIEAETGIKFNLAQATDEAGHRTMQDRRSRNNIILQGMLDEQQQANEKILIDSLMNAPEAGKQNIQLVQQYAREETERQFNAHSALLEQEIAATTAGMRPEEAQQTASKIITESFGSWVEDRKRQLYNLGGAAQRVRIPTAPWKTALREQVAKMSQPAKDALGIAGDDISRSKLPPVIKGILNYGDMESFDTLRGLNHELNTMLYDTSQTAATAQQKRFARELKAVNRRLLDDMMESQQFTLEGGQQTGNFLERAARAGGSEPLDEERAAIASRYVLAKNFHEQSYRYLKDDPIGGRVTGLGKGKEIRPSETLAKYAHGGGGKIEDFDSFVGMVETMQSTGREADAQALEASMREFLLGDMAQTVGFGIESVTPQQRVKNLNAWMRNREHILARYPDLRLKLSNVDAAQRAFNDIATPPKGSMRAHQNKIVEEFTDRTVDEAANEIMTPRLGLTSEQAANYIELRAGKSKEVHEALNTGIYEWLMKRAIDTNVKNLEEPRRQALKSGQFLALLKDHSDFLTKRFGKERIQQWEQIAERAVMNERAKASRTVRDMVPEPEYGFDYMWGWAGVGNYAMSWAKNQQSIGSRVWSLVEKTLRKVDERDVMNYLDGAFLDRDRARLLLTKITPKNEPEVIRRMASGLTASMRARMDTQGEQESQP